MGAEWLVLAVPLVITGIVWILMSNPERQSCKGWSLIDGFHCWRSWLACRLLGRCEAYKDAVKGGDEDA